MKSTNRSSHYRNPRTLRAMTAKIHRTLRQPRSFAYGPGDRLELSYPLDPADRPDWLFHNDFPEMQQTYPLLSVEVEGIRDCLIDPLSPAEVLEDPDRPLSRIVIAGRCRLAVDRQFEIELARNEQLRKGCAGDPARGKARRSTRSKPPQPPKPEACGPYREIPLDATGERWSPPLLWLGIHRTDGPGLRFDSVIAGPFRTGSAIDRRAAIEMLRRLTIREMATGAGADAGMVLRVHLSGQERTGKTPPQTRSCRNAGI